MEIGVRLLRQILRIHIRAHQLIPTPHLHLPALYFIFRLPPLLANLASHSFYTSSNPLATTFSRRSPSIIFVRRFTSRSVLQCHHNQQRYSLYFVVSCDILVRSDCILRILFSTISNCVCTFANYNSTLPNTQTSFVPERGSNAPFTFYNQPTTHQPTLINSSVLL